MTFRINTIGLCIISITCILLIFASHRFASINYATEYYKTSAERSGNLRFPKSSRHGGPMHHGSHRFYDPSFSSGGGGTSPSINSLNNNINVTAITNDILVDQRRRIAAEMEFFEYSRDADNLMTLTPETNGTPYRSIIVTTWRSGSTFLGDILNAMPGNYYHYEPLLNFEIIQIRGAPYAQEAIKNIKQLLHCNYSDMNEYLDYGEAHNNLFSHNTRLWRACRLYSPLCWEPKFLTSFCKVFPLQSMKIVRLRLALAEQLLDDPDLNVRIVLLIRDPRGTLQSRKHREWCPGRPDCDHPPTLCKDMVADYYAAEILNRKYPQRFRAVRYEDLSLEPYKQTQEILEFYGLPFDPMVEDFLDSHTHLDIGGVSSTFRDSKSAPFHWIRDLTYYEIENIQNSCKKAMELWGYKQADEKSIAQKSFNPMLAFPFAAPTTNS